MTRAGFGARRTCFRWTGDHIGARDAGTQDQPNDRHRGKPPLKIGHGGTIGPVVRSQQSQIFATLIIAASAFGMVGGCVPKRSVGVGCPAGYSSNPARLQQLRSKLASAPPARRLLASDSVAPVVCFGRNREAGITPNGTVLLNAETPDAPLAARLAHLWSHLLDPPWVPQGQGACAQRVTMAMQAEQRAAAFECTIREAFALACIKHLNDAQLAASYAQRCKDEGAS